MLRLYTPKTVSHCKSKGNRDFKMLTKTIMFIFVCQVIFNFLFQGFLFVDTYDGIPEQIGLDVYAEKQFKSF